MRSRSDATTAAGSPVAVPGRGKADVLPLVNGLTIDVEDYYMVSAFADRVSFTQWDDYESRVEQTTRRLLDLLEERKVKATFFILGWVAERCPGMVRDLHSCGHEIACHGYNHRLIYHMTSAQFREDVRRAKGVLEDVAGTAVIGYRAPSYSIVAETLWALDILIEEGFRYDSSIFPIHHDRYGLPGAQRFPHVLRRPAGLIQEFPPATYRLFGQNIPFAGGGYLRLFPAPLTLAAMRSINEREKKPFVVYLHPWEIDVEQPRLKGRVTAEIRHYINLGTTLPKLKSFLQHFKFDRLFALLPA